MRECNIGICMLNVTVDCRCVLFEQIRRVVVRRLSIRSNAVVLISLLAPVCDYVVTVTVP